MFCSASFLTPYSTFHALVLNKMSKRGPYCANTPHNGVIFLLMLNKESCPGLQGFIPYSAVLPDIDCAHLINTIFMLKHWAFFSETNVPKHAFLYIYFLTFCQAANSFLFNISQAHFVIQDTSGWKLVEQICTMRLALQLQLCKRAGIIRDMEQE